MTYDPNGQYPPPNQDPNASNYPASGPGYPTSGAGYPTSGAAPSSGGPYPPQGGDPYQQQQQPGQYQGGNLPATPASGAPYPPQGDPYGQQQAGYGQQQGAYQAGGYQGYDAGAYQAGAGAVDPATGQPLSDKTKMVAGLLSIFLGSFGVGRFYTGHIGLAIGQIAVTVVTCGTLGWVWGLIDGIMILVNGGTDSDGRRLRDN